MKLTILSVFLFSAASPAATVISGIAGSASLKPFDVSNSANFIPAAGAAAAQITWSSGPDKLDGAPFLNPPVAEPPQNYFVPAAVGGLAGQAAMPGFAKLSGPGPKGTFGIHWGTGSSTVKPAALGGFTYRAEFTAGAGGLILFPALGGSYQTKTTASDPWFYDVNDFPAPGLTSDLFFQGGLQGADIGELGSTALGVAFETATGILNLLTITMDRTGADVTGDSIPNLDILLFSTFEIDPNITAGSVTTFSAIKALLDADLTDGRIDNPISLGFLLRDVGTPSTLLANGFAAGFSFTLEANDAAQAPEPGTYVLLGIGLVGLSLSSKFRNRKTRIGD